MVGKAVSPGVTRTFRADKDGVDSTKKLIIEFAESEGWVYDRTTESNDAWWASKTVNNLNMTMVVKSSLKHNNSVEVRVF